MIPNDRIILRAAILAYAVRNSEKMIRAAVVAHNRSIRLSYYGNPNIGRKVVLNNG